MARTRRLAYVTLELPAGVVTLKDQKPLIEGNTQLADGWTFADLVRYLNGMTYFWPGSESAPIGPGRSLLKHYAADAPLVLRIRTRDLFEANQELVPLFSAFNSGAPRYHSGKKAIRGPDLFATARKFPRRESEVVELAFAGNPVLPESTIYRTASGWSRLLDPAI